MMISSPAHFPSLFIELSGFPQELLDCFQHFFGKVTKIPDLVRVCLVVLQALHPSGELATPEGITVKSWQLRRYKFCSCLKLSLKSDQADRAFHIHDQHHRFSSSLTYPAVSLLLFPLAELGLQGFRSLQRKAHTQRVKTCFFIIFKS